MIKTIVHACVVAALGVVLSAAAFGASPAQLVIDSRVTIVANPAAPLPIRKATEDLRSDFAKVFGAKPRLVARLQDAGPVAIVIGESASLPQSMVPAGATAPESFSISVSNINENVRAVVLSGPDMRGTIYAIYQFSQDYLGVDPMYYWTDKEPPRRKSIAIPATLSRVFPPPVFKYRGFFINDEDLLTGWAPGEFTDHTAISLAVMDKIYETILRLKGNMVVPGSWIFPDDPQVKLVGERGLVLSQHHATPLGVNVARWPAGVPYNYSTHPEILERAWKNAVAAYDPHQEILWTLGLRGLSDTSYATLDPSVVGDDKHFGMLVSKAIATQMEIVRAAHPDAQFITNLWQEGARLAHAGDLVIPPGVTHVWADQGNGLMQDNGDLAPGQGAYYHVAMYNGHANQLTEWVPVERIYSEMGRYIKAGATGYLLLNTSDIRPVGMTAKAVMDVAWGGVPAGGDRQHYRDWADYEFGTKAAEPVAKIYEEYFRAFAHIPPGAPGAGDAGGDQLFHGAAQEFLMTTMISPPYYELAAQDPKWTPLHILGVGLEPDYYFQIRPDRMPAMAAMAVKLCGAAESGWDAVWRHALEAGKFVAPERRNFYEADVLTMIAINRDSNLILKLVAQAVLDYRAGNKVKARAEAVQTLHVFDELQRYQKKAEYGKWKNWYRGEWLIGMRYTRTLTETFIRFIDDPETTLPPPVRATSWQGYYHIMHYEGDRTVDVH